MHEKDKQNARENVQKEGRKGEKEGGKEGKRREGKEGEEKGVGGRSGRGEEDRGKDRE